MCRASTCTFENPTDCSATRSGFACNDELMGLVPFSVAIDPKAWLDRQGAASAPELPKRAAINPQQRAKPVCRRGNIDAEREVEADGEVRLRWLAAATTRDQRIFAPDFATIHRERKRTPVGEAKAPRIAVMTGLDAAPRVGFLPVKLDLIDAPSERPVYEDSG